MIKPEKSPEEAFQPLSVEISSIPVEQEPSPLSSSDISEALEIEFESEEVERNTFLNQVVTAPQRKFRFPDATNDSSHHANPTHKTQISTNCENIPLYSYHSDTASVVSTEHSFQVAPTKGIETILDGLEDQTVKHLMLLRKYLLTQRLSHGDIKPHFTRLLNALLTWWSHMLTALVGPISEALLYCLNHIANDEELLPLLSKDSLQQFLRVMIISSVSSSRKLPEEAIAQLKDISLLLVVNSDPNAAVRCLISFLQHAVPKKDRIGPIESSDIFQDTVVQLMSKFIKLIPHCMNSLYIEPILRDIYSFFTEKPSREDWKLPGCNPMPYQMIRDLLLTLVKQQGPKILRDIEDIVNSSGLEHGGRKPMIQQYAEAYIKRKFPKYAHDPVIEESIMTKRFEDVVTPPELPTARPGDPSRSETITNNHTEKRTIDSLDRSKRMQISTVFTNSIVPVSIPPLSRPPLYGKPRVPKTIPISRPSSARNSPRIRRETTIQSIPAIQVATTIHTPLSLTPVDDENDIPIAIYGSTLEKRASLNSSILSESSSDLHMLREMMGDPEESECVVEDATQFLSDEIKNLQNQSIQDWCDLQIVNEDLLQQSEDLLSDSGASVDIGQLLGSDTPALTVQEIKEKFLLASGKEEQEKWFNELIILGIPREDLNELIDEKQHMRESASGKVSVEEKAKIVAKVQTKYRDMVRILDQGTDFQKALVWAIEYDENEEKRAMVAELSKIRLSAMLVTYDQRMIDELFLRKRKLLRAWLNPRCGLKKFPDYNKNCFNVIIVGKSGHGKSSFLNTLGKHFGRDFQAKTGVTETTGARTKYELAPLFRIYDVPGKLSSYSTLKVEGGEDGDSYIRDYSIIFFDLVIICTVSRENKFAKNLYNLCHSEGVDAVVVRTKCDEHTKNRTKKDEHQMLKNIKKSMIKNLQAHPSHVFLSRNSYPYYDVPELSKVILEKFVLFHLPGDDIKAILKDKRAGMPQETLQEKYNISMQKIECLHEFRILLRDMSSATETDSYREKKSDEALNVNDWRNGIDYLMSEDDLRTVAPRYSESVSSEAPFTPRTLVREQVHEDLESIYLRQVKIRVDDEITRPYGDAALESLREFATKIIDEYQGMSNSMMEYSKEGFVQLKEIFLKKEIDILRELDHVQNIRVNLKEKMDNYNPRKNAVISPETRLAIQNKIDNEVVKLIEEQENERIADENKMRSWLIEDDSDVKRAYIFGLEYGFDNDKIDQVREIEEDKSNERIRAIPLNDLMSRKADKESIIRKWNFPPPTTFNFNGDQTSRHIGVLGAWGIGKSTFVKAILHHFGKHDEAERIEIHAVTNQQAERKSISFEEIAQTRKYEIAENVWLWDLPGSGENGAEEGIKGRAYIRKYHAIWFSMIYIVTANRFYEFDIELGKICLAENRQFSFVRTKFDIDLAAELRDKGVYTKHGTDYRDFRNQLCLEVKTELHALMVQRGIRSQSILNTSLYFVDGRDSSLLHFETLLKDLTAFILQSDMDLLPTSLLEDHIYFRSESCEFLLTLVASLGKEYNGIVEKLRETCSDLHDFVEFNDDDFKEIGVGRKLVRLRLESLITRAIKSLPKIEIDISNYTPSQVKDYVSAFGPYCEQLGEALRKDSISGDLLMMLKPEFVLYEYEGYFLEIIDNEVRPIQGVKRRNILRRLRRTHQPYRKLTEDPLESKSYVDDEILVDPDIHGGDEIQSDNEIVQEKSSALDHKGSEPSKKVSETDARKIAAVLVVSKGRNAQLAIKEAWELEKAFISAGYDICFYGNRTDIHEAPITAQKRHFDEVTKQINAQRDSLKGAFIFITANGYTDTSGIMDLPLICTEDFEIDVFEFLQNYTETRFPVLFGINACRIYAGSNPRRRKEDFSFSLNDLPRNLFVSWGCPKSKHAVEGKLTEAWRITLQDERFQEEDINILAGNIARQVGGSCVSGISDSWPCVGGVFVESQEETSKRKMMK